MMPNPQINPVLREIKTVWKGLRDEKS